MIVDNVVVCGRAKCITKEWSTNQVSTDLVNPSGMHHSSSFSMEAECPGFHWDMRNKHSSVSSYIK